MSEQENGALRELQIQVSRIEQALLGYNGQHGQPGLCKQVDRLAKDYYKFKRICCIVFGVLVGTGVLFFGYPMVV